jgi:hypothetical protein
MLFRLRRRIVSVLVARGSNGAHAVLPYLKGQNARRHTQFLWKRQTQWEPFAAYSALNPTVRMSAAIPLKKTI